MTEKKHQISLTTTELRTLALLMHHLTDYIGGDDRPDHGLAMLAPLRGAPDKTVYYRLAGYLERRRREAS